MADQTTEPAAEQKTEESNETKDLFDVHKANERELQAEFDKYSKELEAKDDGGAPIGDPPSDRPPVGDPKAETSVAPAEGGASDGESGEVAAIASSSDAVEKKDEPAPIEADQRWTQDQQTSFAKLPREAQEIVKSFADERNQWENNHSSFSLFFPNCFHCHW